jgi:ubiquitin-protein ligase
MSINDTEPKFISREAIHRLLSDVKYIYKNPLTDNGIYYTHDDSDIMKGYAMIVGPEDTPYFGGYYFFEFNFPTNYPFSPPKVKYMTNNGYTRFNPNLYKCGKVCVSILNTWSGDKWSACQTINSVLLTLCSLLNDSPLLNEPGQTINSVDYIPYQKSIEYMNIDFAICELLDKSLNRIPQQFIHFYPYMKEVFLKNYDKLLNFVENKNKPQGGGCSEIGPGTEDVFIVRIYQMTTKVNYETLKTKLITVKCSIE